MTDNEKIKVDQWRATNGYADKAGVVIIFYDNVQGWVNELRDPEHWQPGCIAIDICGNKWIANGGNNSEGAKSWQPVVE